MRGRESCEGAQRANAALLCFKQSYSNWMRSSNWTQSTCRIRQNHSILEVACRNAKIGRSAKKKLVASHPVRSCPNPFLPLPTLLFLSSFLRFEWRSFHSVTPLAFMHSCDSAVFQSVWLSYLTSLSASSLSLTMIPHSIATLRLWSGEFHLARNRRRR